MTSLEFLIGLFIIVVVYYVIKKPSWTAHNRTSPDGMCTDWGKMSMDRTNGMSQRDVNIKFNNGGYDVKATKIGTPDRNADK